MLKEEYVSIRHVGLVKYPIYKDSLRDVTGFYSTEKVPSLKLVKNEEINWLAHVVLDKRALRIDRIVYLGVKYVTMGISYKVYYKNREGSSSSTTMYVAYQMVKVKVFYSTLR